MSDQAFHKILCNHCAGKIEFPAEYAGQTIPCPHCQTLVLLKVPPADAATAFDYPNPATLTPEDVAKGQKAKWNIIYAAAILIGINLVMGAVFLLRGKSDGPLEGVQVTTWKLEPGEYRTYYITGIVSNSTAKAIAKARIDFETSDNAGNASGLVSVQISNLAPNSMAEFSAQTSPTQAVWDAKVLGIFMDKN